MPDDSEFLQNAPNLHL